MILSTTRTVSKVQSIVALFLLCAVTLLLYHRSVVYSTWTNAATPLARAKAATTAATTKAAAHKTNSSQSLIPKKIWYKLGPKGLTENMRKWTDTCIKNNTNYEYEFMTDEKADAFVAKTFALHPEVVNTYLNLTVPILKADILRYLLLFSKGGIWSDLDVSCEGPPIDEWIPEQYKSKAALVVGWEFDYGHKGNILRQFASWTIMAKPGLPHMWMVVEEIIKGIKEKTIKHKMPISQLTREEVGDIVDFTGPRRLTRSVFKSLELKHDIDRKKLILLLQPKLIHDVLIMPGYSFSPSTNKYDDTVKSKMGPNLVRHHYAGSWKNPKGGEQPT